MLNEKFSDIQEDYLKAKEVYELSLEKLLNQAPNFSKDTLNNINSNFSKFHTKFEEFLTNISSENYDLSKTQIQDVLASIQNILDASIKYWNIIGNVSEKLIGSRFKPQNNFFKTAQGILRTYDNKKAKVLEQEFIKNNLPIEGFISKEKYKLTSSKIDWTVLSIGIISLILSLIIIFFNRFGYFLLLKLAAQAFEQKTLFSLFLASKVLSGDSSNMEGVAANFYWKSFFEHNFKRERFGDYPNNFLNYGYAILRAATARALSGSGLLNTLGIHHKSKYNAFALADDIMEPYRPYVDELVCDIMKKGGDYGMLTKELKGQLLTIPSLDVIISGKRSPLMIAVGQTTASLYKCFNGELRKITYPEM